MLGIVNLARFRADLAQFKFWTADVVVVIAIPLKISRTASRFSRQHTLDQRFL